MNIKSNRLRNFTIFIQCTSLLVEVNDVGFPQSFGIKIDRLQIIIIRLIPDKPRIHPRDHLPRVNH